MFDVLLSGKLRGAPTTKPTRNGGQFVTFRLSVPTGKDGGYFTASCIGFQTSVIDTMSAMDDGDSVAVNGEAALTTWDGKNGVQAGLNVTVHGVLTAYHLGRKREAVGKAQADHATRVAGTPPPAGHPATAPKFKHPDFAQPDLSGPDPEGWDNLDGV